MRNLFGCLFLLALGTSLYFIWVAIKEILIAMLMIFITWVLYYAAGGGKPTKKNPD